MKHLSKAILLLFCCYCCADTLPRNYFAINTLFYPANLAVQYNTDEYTYFQFNPNIKFRLESVNLGLAQQMSFFPCLKYHRNILTFPDIISACFEVGIICPLSNQDDLTAIFNVYASLGLFYKKTLLDRLYFYSNLQPLQFGHIFDPENKDETYLNIFYNPLLEIGFTFIL
jgi:hypothetical protein